MVAFVECKSGRCKNSMYRDKARRNMKRKTAARAQNTKRGTGQYESIPLYSALFEKTTLLQCEWTFSTND